MVRPTTQLRRQHNAHASFCVGARIVVSQGDLQAIAGVGQLGWENGPHASREVDGTYDAGDLISRSGGLRKIRVAASGRGKRGGARVIYYWVVAKDQIYMLLAYAKNAQEDLTV
jgi:hypothetical protein